MADQKYHSHESEQPATGIESCMTTDAHPMLDSAHLTATPDGDA